MARPRPTCRRCAGEYLSERKTNSSLCIHPSSSFSRTRGERAEGEKCGLFVEKSHFPSGEPQLRASHCLREGCCEGGMLRGEGEEGRGRGGEGKKHRAYTRRTSANISSGQPPIFSTPFAPVLDIALEKKLPSRYENVSPSFALLPSL